jgi:hypothetical protein
MSKPDLPATGGSYTRDEKGALTQVEATRPAKSPEPRATRKAAKPTRKES